MIKVCNISIENPPQDLRPYFKNLYPEAKVRGLRYLNTRDIDITGPANISLNGTKNQIKEYQITLEYPDEAFPEEIARPYRSQLF